MGASGSRKENFRSRRCSALRLDEATFALLPVSRDSHPFPECLLVAGGTDKDPTLHPHLHVLDLTTATAARCFDQFWRGVAKIVSW